MNLAKIKNTLKKYNYTEYFIVAEYFLALLICIITSLGGDVYTSIPHALIYALLYVMFAIKLVDTFFIKKNGDSLLIMLIVTLALFIMLITYPLAKNGFRELSVGYFKEYVFTAGSMILFFIFYKSPISRNTLKILASMCIAVTLFYFVIYFVLGDINYTLWNETWQRYLVSKYLMFRLGNPNKTAIMLLFLYLNCMVGVAVFDRKFAKIISALVSAFAFFLIFKTLSRNALIIFVMFNCGATIILFFRKFKVKNYMWAIAFLLPILFVVVYMLIVDMPLVQRVFSIISNPEKLISSREKIWTYALDCFGRNPVIGDYYLMWKENMSNMHNTHLYILSKFGALGFISFSIYMYILLRKFCASCESKIQHFALLAFGASLLTGFAEAAVFVGSSGLFILCGGLLAYVNGLKGIKLESEKSSLELVKPEGKS